MKICVTSPFHPMLYPGGAQQSAYEIFQAIRARHPDTLFLCAMHESGAGRANQALKRFGLGDNEHVFGAEQFDHFWHQYNDPRKTSEIVHFLKREQVTTLLLGHFMHFGLDLIPAAADAGIDVYLCVHEMLLSCYSNGQMVTTARQLCTRSAPERCAQCFPEIGADMFYLRRGHFLKSVESATRIFSPSEFLKRRLMDFGVPEEKFRVIRHGVNAGGFEEEAPPRAATAGDGRPVTFGFFGQLVDNKGVQVLLAAAEILERELADSPRPERKRGKAQRRGGPEIRITINGANLDAGSEGFRQLYSELLERSRDWTAVKVIERGPYAHRQLPARMGEVDFVVVPSTWWEIYCMVVDEAQFFGRPVIASRIGGMPERIVDQKDGLLFSAGDAYDLAEKMRLAIAGTHRLAPSRAGVPGWDALAGEYLDAMGADEPALEPAG